MKRQATSRSLKFAARDLIERRVARVAEIAAVGGPFARRRAALGGDGRRGGNHGRHHPDPRRGGRHGAEYTSGACVRAARRRRSAGDWRCPRESHRPRNRRRYRRRCRRRGPDQDEPDRSAADLRDVSGPLHPGRGAARLYQEGGRREADRPAGARRRDRQGAHRHRHRASRQARQAAARIGGRARPGERGLSHDRRHGHAHAGARHHQPEAPSGHAADRARVQRPRQQRLRDPQRRRATTSRPATWW